MIRFSLHCKNGHEFETWFGSNSDYSKQKQDGLLSCPHCGSGDVEKSLMAPNVSSSKHRGKTIAASEGGEPGAASVPAAQLSNLSEAQTKLLPAMRELRNKLLEGAENVGEKFSEEARKIHYGETKARSIYGNANLEEAAKLSEEGIDFLPLPVLPEDKN